MIKNKKTYVGISIFLFTGLAASVILACTHTNSPDAAISPPSGQLVSAAQILDQTTGSFTAMGTPSASPIKARFQGGCLNPGEDEPAFASIDPRLKVGQQFQTRIQTGSPGETMDYTSGGTVVTVEESRAVLRGQIETSRGLNGAGAGTPFSTTCTVQTETDGSSATPTSQTVACIADHSLENPKHQNCRVEQTKPEISEVAGTFKFSNGTDVPAFKVTHKSTGTVYCQFEGDTETAMGPGHEISVTIVSNDVVSLAPRDCGGNLIYSYHAVSTDAGVLEAVEKNEQRNMP